MTELEKMLLKAFEDLEQKYQEVINTNQILNNQCEQGLAQMKSLEKLLEDKNK